MPKYEVRYFEGHMLESDPEPLRFPAVSDALARMWVSEEVGMPVEKLHEAGVEKVVRLEGGKEIVIWPVEKPAGNFYPHTIAMCRKSLLFRFPDLQPIDSKLPDFYRVFAVGHPDAVQALVSYFLWMLEQIPTFEDAEKRARWIGYVLFGCEALGLFTNTESREAVRKDVEQSKSGT